MVGAVAEGSTARNKCLCGLQVVVPGLTVDVIFYVHKRTHATRIIPKERKRFNKNKKKLERRPGTPEWSEVPFD